MDSVCGVAGTQLADEGGKGMKWVYTFWDNLVMGMSTLWNGILSLVDDRRVSPQKLIELSSVENMSESMRHSHIALLLMANAGSAIGMPSQEEDELLVPYPEMR